MGNSSRKLKNIIIDDSEGNNESDKRQTRSSRLKSKLPFLR